MPMARRMDIDPRSARVAHNLMASAMQDVANLRFRHDVGHYQEREQMPRQDTAAWVEHGGKEIADAAVRGLHFVFPDECLTIRERTVLRDREKA